MTVKDKAWELLEKINNAPIEKADWVFSSNYAINDLKRKALIVADEVLGTLYEYHYDSNSGAYEYWQEVKQEIINI